MDLLEVGGGVMDWIDLAEDMDAGGACECCNESSGCLKCGEFLDQLWK